MASVSVCDNCGSQTRKTQDKIISTWDMTSISTNEIPISTALSVLFEQPPLVSKYKIQPSKVGIHGAVFSTTKGLNSLNFCMLCSTKLATVYNGFIELIRLCELKSQVATKLRQINQLSRLCAHVELTGKASRKRQRKPLNASASSIRTIGKTDHHEDFVDQLCDALDVEHAVEIKVEVPDSHFLDEGDIYYGHEEGEADAEAYDDFKDLANFESPTPENRPKRASALNALKTFTESDSDENDEEVDLKFCVKPGDNSSGSASDSDPAGGESESDSDYEDEIRKKGRPKRVKTRLEGDSIRSHYYCSSCNKNFSQKSGLNRHMRQFHSGIVKTFECPFCQSPKQFKRHDELRKHCREFHGKESLQKLEQDGVRDCDICSRKFSTHTFLLKHLESKHLVRSDRSVEEDEECTKCHKCEQIFSSNAALRRHITTLHSGIIYECPFDECARSFARKDYVKDHLLAVHNGQKIEEFYQKAQTRTNPNRDDAEKLFCKICNKHFLRPNILRRHMNSHSGVTFKCPFEDCDKIFARRSYVINHLKRMHGGAMVQEFYRDTKDQDESPKTCEICGINFRHSSALHRHLHLHKGADVKCPFEACGKLFKQKDYLRAHLHRVHDGEHVEQTYGDPYNDNNDNDNEDKPKSHNTASDISKRIRKRYREIIKVPCEQCGVSIRKDTMRQHMMVHTGEKPELCEHCGKSFRLFSTLKIHLREVHNINRKSYPCPHCSEVFKRNSIRKVHVERMHEDTSKAYKCDKEGCGKVFRYARNLREHMRLHDGNKTNTCEMCNKTFSRASNLRNHINCVHLGLNVYKKPSDDPNRVIKKRIRLGRDVSLKDADPAANDEPGVEEDASSGSDEEEEEEPEAVVDPLLGYL